MINGDDDGMGWLPKSDGFNSEPLGFPSPDSDSDYDDSNNLGQNRGRGLSGSASQSSRFGNQDNNNGYNGSGDSNRD